MADHDLYQLLGVDPNASASELRKAYLREARTHHPDKAGANPKADDDRFFHLKRAYDILSHPVRRLVYDKREYTTIQLLHTSPLFDADDFFEQHPWLRPGPAETTLASPQSGVSSSSSSTSSSSSSFVQAPAPRESPPSPRERDVPSPDITTIDASTTTALADSPAPSSRPHTTDSPTKLAPSSPKSQSSPTANDSGAPITLATRRDSQNSPGQAPPANHPVDASHRKTELWLDLEDRLFPSVKEVSVSRTVLPKHGPRREETILLTVDVQPHWEHGTVVTFGGAGDVVEDGSHEFDYHVHICFRPHPIYTCQGSDLLAVAKVSLWGALYGCTTVLPLPDGTEHLIPLDSVAPDTKYRIPGAGLRKASTTEPDRVSRPASERALEKPHALRGDIWVEFVIDTPEAPAELPFSKCTYPTHWTAIPVACERCQRRHCSGEVDTCKFHPGALLAEITLDAGPAPPATLTACSPQANAMLRSAEAPSHGTWSCCRAPANHPGCQQAPKHNPHPESVARAHAIAAHNRLKCAIDHGDPYQVGLQLLACRDSELDIMASRAMSACNFFALIILLRAGADVPHAHGLAGALAQTAQTDAHLVRQLLRVLAVDPELVDLLRRIPHVLAIIYGVLCEQGHCDAVIAVLEHPRIMPHQCKVQEMQDRSYALLMAAAARNHRRCAELLLNTGVLPDAPSAAVLGRTPLLEAISRGHTDMVGLLLARGANSDRVGLFGALMESATPLAAAARLGHVVILRQLLAAGARTDQAEPQFGRTALHEAALHGRHVMAAMLVAAGARTHVRDLDGLRPLDLALQCNNWLVAKTIQPAMVQEALHSMQGLTLVRILYDELNTEEPDILSEPRYQNAGPLLGQRSRRHSFAEAGVVARPMQTSSSIARRLSREESNGTGSTEALRGRLVVLEDALSTLCSFSDGLGAACQADLCGSRQGVARAIRAYELWRQACDNPRRSVDLGASTISALISAGIGVKTRLQQRLDGVSPV